MDETEKRGRGTPSTYDPAVIPLARELAEGGATNNEIARELGVDQSTLRRWRAKYPDFRTAVKVGKDSADDLVEATLFQKAVGYTYDEIETKEVDGEVIEKRVERRVDPDTVAMIFWLKNRRPDEWREKSTLEVTGDLAERLDAAFRRVKD